jgi:hypothetical protein
MKNYIYVQGVGFVRNETKSEFRKKKMSYAHLRDYTPFFFDRKPNQETDLN